MVEVDGRVETAARLAAYRNDIWPNVHGWVEPSVISALGSVALYQEDHSVIGDALEVGVFHGRFFLALLAAINVGERAVAIDIFDSDALNVDHSAGGPGTRAAFESNVAQFAPQPNAFDIVAADSMTTRANDIMALSPSKGFRLISVDGGHTAEHVMNDMGLAADLITSGGVVMLDDWMSPHWPGVHEGYLRFMLTRNRNLAPVLYTGNKLFLTTIPHQSAMIEWLWQYYKTGQDIRRVKSCGFGFLSAV